MIKNPEKKFLKKGVKFRGLSKVIRLPANKVERQESELRSEKDKCSVQEQKTGENQHGKDTRN